MHQQYIIMPFYPPQLHTDITSVNSNHHSNLCCHSSIGTPLEPLMGIAPPAPTPPLFNIAATGISHQPLSTNHHPTLVNSEQPLRGFRKAIRLARLRGTNPIRTHGLDRSAYLLLISFPFSSSIPFSKVSGRVHPSGILTTFQPTSLKVCTTFCSHAQSSVHPNRTTYEL